MGCMADLHSLLRIAASGPPALAHHLSGLTHPPRPALLAAGTLSFRTPSQVCVWGAWLIVGAGGRAVGCSCASIRHVLCSPRVQVPSSLPPPTAAVLLPARLAPAAPAVDNVPYLLGRAPAAACVRWVPGKPTLLHLVPRPGRTDAQARSLLGLVGECEGKAACSASIGLHQVHPADSCRHAPSLTQPTNQPPTPPPCPRPLHRAARWSPVPSPCPPSSSSTTPTPMRRRAGGAWWWTQSTTTRCRLLAGRRWRSSRCALLWLGYWSGGLYSGAYVAVSATGGHCRDLVRILFLTHLLPLLPPLQIDPDVAFRSRLRRVEVDLVTGVQRITAAFDQYLEMVAVNETRGVGGWVILGKGLGWGGWLWPGWSYWLAAGL